MCIYIAGAFAAHQLNTDFGRLKVLRVSIPAEDYALSGLLYIPPEAHPDNPRPGVVVAHGISNAKETVSGIALELAKRGTVALSLDLAGHGESGGSLSPDDPSFGVIAAVRFLRSLDYVDTGLVGLVGHSLGAGASRSAASADGGVYAVAFIGGGIGGMSEGPDYGALNSSFPRNLLVAVGRQDILFDLRELGSDLRPVFNASDPIVVGELYGDFSEGDARRLLTPSTIHLAEPLDPAVVSGVAAWMNAASDSPSGRELPDSDLIYLYREAALLLVLVVLIGMILPLSKVLMGPLSLGALRSRHVLRVGRMSDLKVLLVWGGLGLGLYLPFMGLGAAIPFPPLIFGSSMAWWLLGTGLAGLLVLRFFPRSLSPARFSLREAISRSITPGDAALGAALFVFLYTMAYPLDTFLLVDPRIITPLFKALTPRRVLVFPTFIPFYLVYFLAEGLYLHRFRAGRHGGLWGLLRAVSLKAAPYLAVLLIQYAPMFLLGVRPLPGFVGFFVEFIWAIVPLFVVSTVVSWWLYGLTSRTGSGALLNALIFAWISAAIFPFGSFA